MPIKRTLKKSPFVDDEAEERNTDSDGRDSDGPYIDDADDEMAEVPEGNELDYIQYIADRQRDYDDLKDEVEKLKKEVALLKQEISDLKGIDEEFRRENFCRHVK